MGSVSINDAGRFVVVWQRTPAQSDDSELLARRFDEQADALGTSISVSEDVDTPACCPHSIKQSDGSGPGVFARRVRNDAE